LVKEEYGYPKRRSSFYFTGDLHKYTDTLFGAKIKKQRKHEKSFFKNLFEASFIVLFLALCYCLQIAYRCGGNVMNQCVGEESLPFSLIG
jgi:hypothetical protein